MFCTYFCIAADVVYEDPALTDQDRQALQKIFRLYLSQADRLARAVVGHEQDAFPAVRVSANARHDYSCPFIGFVFLPLR